MSPCERIIRNAYASPHLRGERRRIALWERVWWGRKRRHDRWNARRRFLMANAEWLGLEKPHEVLGPVPGWRAV